MSYSRLTIIGDLILIFILAFVITGCLGCKSSTRPHSIADCDPGFLPCEDDSAECCAVICEDGQYNCGDMLMDCCQTTNSDFVWEFHTPGQYMSQLRGAEIVDSDNIWVVGSLSIPDSTLLYPGEMNYNMGYWDGYHWQYKKVFDPHISLYSIKVFSDSNIWVTSFGFPINWDGEAWTLYQLQDMGLNVSVGFAQWGNAPNNIFFVGLAGGIVQFNGESFTQHDSGTDIDLMDIEGSDDGNSVFVVGFDNSGRSIVIEHVDGYWSELYSGSSSNSLPYGKVQSVTVIDSTALFACSNGLWKYNYYSNTSELIPKVDLLMENHTIRKIVGHESNDIIIISNWGKISHFNGASWIADNTILNYWGSSNATIKNFDFLDNVAIAVGYCCFGDNSLIIKGYR